MHFLRVFIPSWRFFDDLGPIPQLQFRFRTGATMSQSETWKIYPQKPETRSWWNLFLNPEGNLYLAKLSLVEQFLTELNSLPVEQTKAFSMIQNWLQSEYPSATHFQFRILIDGEEAFLSPEWNKP